MTRLLVDLARRAERVRQVRDRMFDIWLDSEPGPVGDQCWRAYGHAKIELGAVLETLLAAVLAHAGDSLERQLEASVTAAKAAYGTKGGRTWESE